MTVVCGSTADEDEWRRRDARGGNHGDVESSLCDVDTPGYVSVYVNATLMLDVHQPTLTRFMHDGASIQLGTIFHYTVMTKPSITCMH